MFLTEPKKPDVLKIYNNAMRKENKSFFKKGSGLFSQCHFSSSLFHFNLYG